MGRATRAFKLKVSPDGFDLIVDCHVRLVRRTRTLLPYGTTVNVAIHYLATLDLERLVAAVSRFPRITLLGGGNVRTVFVGAPRSMAELARDVAARLRTVMPDWQVPDMAELYLLSLQELLDAENEEVEAAYGRAQRPARDGSRSPVDGFSFSRSSTRKPPL